MRLSIIVAAALLPSLALAADTTTTPHPGIKRVKRVTATQNINILIVDLCAAGVSIRATKSNERQRTVSSFGALVGAKAAINGDFFNFENYGTNGPSMGDGAAWGNSDHTYVAPLQFGDHKIALPGHAGTAGVEPWARQVVSGHPTLLVDGTRQPGNNGDSLCTARHPRTAAGYTKDKRTLILAVVDGRASTRLGYTCDELTTLMAEFGAHDAVNLDGGGSSAMWVAGPGVVNLPSDGTQRVVANHLAVRATGSGAAPHCPVPPYAATFVGSSIATDQPLELTSGAESTVWFELDNTGDRAWKPTTTRVGTQEPQDRESVFVKTGDWLGANRPTAADMTYAPGTTGRFTWTMVAPVVTEMTTFEETFQLVEESVAWFGPKKTLSIIVHPPGTDPDDTDDTDDTDSAGGDAGGCATSSGDASVLVLLAMLLVPRRRRSRQ